MLDAESARREGQFEEERRHFEEAAELAKKPDDADEARYRWAQSFSREGRFEIAARELESFARKFPESGRAARAWLDAGRNWERTEAPKRALAAYLHVVKSYPDSGGALSAATRVVALRSQLHGSVKHEELRKLLEENRSADLDEGLRYLYAQALEEISQRQALVAYEDVAKNHPLPHGSYCDEALLRAAQLRLEMKDPGGAITTLDLLLDQGGPAAIVGSYTRTAYIEALLLKGKIQRDELGHSRQALKTFRSLPEKYPNSRLVDDALWEAVLTERLLGETGCASMQALARVRPESRFARCLGYLCSNDTSDETKTERCERWLEVSTDDR